jgi:O-antigen/teichoic acid export membrane protein
MSVVQSAAVMPRRVAWNTLSNYAGKLATIASGIILTPFILHQVGPVSYGLWVLVGSVVGYGSLLDLGISSAIIKYVAEYRARGQADEARRLVATALWLYTALAVVVVGLSALGAPLFPRLFQVPPADRETAVWLVFLAGAGTGLGLPCSTAGAVLRGLHRFDLQNVLVLASALLSTIGTIVVLLLGGGIIGVMLVSITIMLVLQAPAIWLVRRAAPDVGVSWRGGSLARVGPVLGFSSWLFAINAAGRVQTKSDEIVIGSFLPVAAVTPYALANKLSDVALMLADQFMKVLLPLASELHAGGDLARLRALYLTSTRLTLAILVPVGGTLAVLAGPLLGAWVGAAYSEYAYLVVILILADAISASQWPAGSVLQAMVRHRLLAVTAVASAIVNLGLSIVLLPRLGLAGVALGTLIPTAISSLGFVLPFTMRVLCVKPGQVMREVLVPTLVPALAMGGVTWTLVSTTRPESLLSLGIVAVLALATYALGYLCLGASEFERRTYRTFAIGTLRLIGGRLGRSSGPAA